jgi:glycosyltransferase involved in cell wall biosynthesis
LPRVTVIIATYNWSAVLAHSVASVLDQTFADFELLVVGDGCTDDSGDVVTALGDPRVHWHNLPENTGHQSAPNNEGIRMAEGDLIAYLGHDDLWLPNHLEVLVNAIDGGAEIAHGMTLTVTPVGRPQTVPRGGWVYTPGDYIAPTAVVHTRRLVEIAGGWLHPRETGTLEPEMHLWRQMAETARPQLVRRMTSVKLPAADRAGVYRTQPQHEQAYWLHRIRAASDPEASVRAAGDEPYVFGKDSRAAVIRDRLTHPRVRRPARMALGRLGVPPVFTSAEGRWRRRRRYKGVDDR